MELLTTYQTAKMLNVSEQTIRTFVKDGRLGAYKVGRAYRFSEEQIKRFLQRERK